MSRGSSNSGRDSFLFLQTHLWFLSESLNYRLPVRHPCLGSLQKALIVLQYITVLQSFKKTKKMLVGDWHETSKLILSAAWKGLWATGPGGEKLMFWLPLPAVSPMPWQRGCSLTLLQSDLILLKIFFEVITIKMFLCPSVLEIAHQLIHTRVCCRESSSCQHRWSAEVRRIVYRAGGHWQGCTGADDAGGISPCCWSSQYSV